MIARSLITAVALAAMCHRHGIVNAGRAYRFGLAAARGDREMDAAQAAIDRGDLDTAGAHLVAADRHRVRMTALAAAIQPQA